MRVFYLYDIYPRSGRVLQTLVLRLLNVHFVACSRSGRLGYSREINSQDALVEALRAQQVSRISAIMEAKGSPCYHHGGYTWPWFMYRLSNGGCMQDAQVEEVGKFFFDNATRYTGHLPQVLEGVPIFVTHSAVGSPIPILVIVTGCEEVSIQIEQILAEADRQSMSDGGITLHDSGLMSREITCDFLSGARAVVYDTQAWQKAVSSSLLGCPKVALCHNFLIPMEGGRLIHCRYNVDIGEDFPEMHDPFAPGFPGPSSENPRLSSVSFTGYGPNWHLEQGCFIPPVIVADPRASMLDRIGLVSDEPHAEALISSYESGLLIYCMAHHVIALGHNREWAYSNLSPSDDPSEGFSMFSFAQQGRAGEFIRDMHRHGHITPALVM